MRLPALALALAFGTFASAMSANAAPVIPNPDVQGASNIIQVSGGCGRGWHRTWRGFCARNFYRPYAYYRPYYRPYVYYRPYHRHYWYGGGWHRPYRYWYGY